MKKLVKSLLALSILGLTGGTAIAGGMFYANESGKQESSYAETNSTTTKIGSADDLSNLKTKNANVTYELTSDIDLGGRLWTPIGTKDAPFQGTILGNGYTISGSIIVPESVLSNYYGIFGYTSEAKIYDLSIGESFTYIGANAISGSLIGYAKDTTVAAVYDKSSMTNTIGEVSGTGTTIYRGGNNLGGKATSVATTVRVGAGTATDGFAVAFNVDDKEDTTKSAYYEDTNGNKLMRNTTDKTETYYVAINKANKAQTLTNAPKNFGTTYPNVEGAVSAKRKGYELVSESEWKGIKGALYPSNSGFALEALKGENYTLRANWNQVTYTFNRYDKIGTTGSETANGELEANMYSKWTDSLFKITNSSRVLIGLAIYDENNNLKAEAKRTLTYDPSGNPSTGGATWVYYRNGKEYTGTDKDEIVLDEKSGTYKLVATWQAVTVQAEILYPKGHKVGLVGLTAYWKQNEEEENVPVDANNRFSLLGNTPFTLKFALRDGYSVDSVTIKGRELISTNETIGYEEDLTQSTEVENGVNYHVYKCKRGVLSNDNKVNISVSQVEKDIKIKPNESTIIESEDIGGTVLKTKLPSGALINDTNTQLKTFVDESHTLVFKAKDGNGIKKIATSKYLECKSVVIWYYYNDSNGSLKNTTNSDEVPNYGAEYAVINFIPETITIPGNTAEQGSYAHISVETVSRSISVKFKREGNSAYPDGINSENPALSASSGNNTANSDTNLSLKDNTGVITITAASNKYYRVTKLTVNGETVSAVEGASGTYKFNVIPEGTYVIKAIYEKPIYKIKFNTLTTSTELADISGNLGVGIKLPSKEDLTKEGYTFAAWKYGEEEVKWTAIPDLPAFSTSNTITLTAKWTANKYNVTLDPNGGKFAPSDKNVVEVKYDGKYGQLPTPTWAGHTFSGWWTSKEGGTKVEATTVMNTAGEHTLYAHWTVIKYSINYIDGLTGSAITNLNNPTEYTTETAEFTLENPTKKGHTFRGWSGPDIDGYSTNLKINPTTFTDSQIGNKTYTANWDIVTYTITYNLAGGTLSSGTNPAEYNVTTNSITLINPTKVGYKFTGWSGTGIEGYSTSVTIPTGSTGNRTYTAHWTANSYKLVFNNNDGTGTKTDNVNISYDEVISGKFPTAPTAQGLTFKGWAIEKTTENFIIVSNADIFNNSFISGIENNAGGTYTLYAMWEINESDIIYALNLNSINVVKTSGNGHVVLSNFASGTVYGNRTSATNLFNVEVYKDNVITAPATVGSWAKSVTLTITLNGNAVPKIECTIVPFEGMKNAFATKIITDPAYFGVTVKEYNFEIIQNKDQLDLAAKYIYTKINPKNTLETTREERISQGRDTLLKLMKANSTLKTNIYKALKGDLNSSLSDEDLNRSLSNDELDKALCSMFGLLKGNLDIWKTNIDEVIISDAGAIDINSGLFKGWEGLEAGVYDSWWKLSGDLTNVNLGTLDTDYKVINGVYYVRNNKTVKGTNYYFVKDQEVISVALPDNARMLHREGEPVDCYIYEYKHEEPKDTVKYTVRIKTSSGYSGEYTQIGDANYFTIETVVDENGNVITNSALFWIPGTLTIQDANLPKLKYDLDGVYAFEGYLNHEIVGVEEFTPTIAVTKIKYNNVNYDYETKGFSIDANGLVSIKGTDETETLLGYIFGQGTANLTVQLLQGITFEYIVTQPDRGRFAKGNRVGLLEVGVYTNPIDYDNDIKYELSYKDPKSPNFNKKGSLTREVEISSTNWERKLVLTRAVAVIVDLSSRYRDFADMFFVNMGENIDLLDIYPMTLNLSYIAENPEAIEFTLMGQYKDADENKWYIFELPGGGSIFNTGVGEEVMPTMRAILNKDAYEKLTPNANGTYHLPADTILNTVAHPGFTYTTVTGDPSEVTIEGTVVGIADQHTSFDPAHVKVNWAPYSIPLIKGTSDKNFTTSETGTSFDAKDFIESIEGFSYGENGIDTISYEWEGTNSNILTLKSVDDAKTYRIVITLKGNNEKYFEKYHSQEYGSITYVYYVTFTAVKQTINKVEISSANGLSNATNSYVYANKDLYNGFAVTFKDASENVMTLGSGMYTVTKETEAKNIGNYSVKIALTDEGKKYYGFEDYTFAFEITKKEISISDADISNKTKVYDGKALIATSVYTELGERVDITFKAVGPEANSYKAEVESVKVGGVDGNNYTVKLVDENNTWLSIDTYSYTLKESDIKDGSKTKVYIGQTLTPDEITLTLIEGETLTISFNEAGKDVGSYSPTIKSIKINSNATSNYAITLPDNKWFSITPFKYTLKESDVNFSKVYGQVDPILSKEFAVGEVAHEDNTELKNPDALTLTFTRANGDTAGTYALLTVTVDDVNKNNYAITLPDNNWFSITKAELTFTVSKVYDGTTTFTNENVTGVTGKVGEDEILISGNYPSKDAATSAEITTYTLSGAARANYSVKAVTGSIAKFTYMLKQEDVNLSKVYGHADPELKLTLVKNSEGINNPDELIITFTRASGDTVGKYKLTIASVKYSSGDDATNNYTITIPDDNTFFEIEAVKQGLMVAVDGEFAMTYDTTTVTRVATEFDSNKWYLAAYTADNILKARVGLSLYYNDKVNEDTWEIKAVTSDLEKMFNGITISIPESVRNVGKFALSISGHNEIYTVDATFVDSSYVSASPVFEIKKFTKVLTASELTKDDSWTKAYDGTALTPNSVTKEFIAGETVTINFSPVGTDAKKYVLSVSGTDNANYKISVEENELLEITKRAYTLTASDVESVNSKVYTNSTITPDSIELTLVNNEKLTISFNSVSGTTAGEYEMVVNSVMLGENVAANYDIKAEVGNKWFNITKFKYTVVEGDLGQDYVRTKAYDGTGLQPTAITKEFNGETIEIRFKETGANVGDYSLEFANVNNDNYEITISANKWLKITKYTYELQESDLTTSESKTAVYTSNAITPGAITLEKVSGEILTISFEDVEKTVGKKSLVIKSVMIGETEATNYNITIPSENTWFTITKAELTVVITKEYDGTTVFTNENANITGLMSGDSVTVEGNFDSAEVTSEEVSITDITLSGADKDNYSVTATGKILKANLTGITVADVTKTYGDIKESEDYATLLSGTLTFSSAQVKNAVITSAEIVSPTYSTGRFLQVGEYDVNLRVSSDTVENFDVKLKLVIEAKALTVKLMKNGSEINSVSKYFDGSDALPEGVTVAVDGLCEGDQVELTAKFRSADVSTSLPIDYTFTVDTDKDNYNITYTVQKGTIGSYVFSKITLNNSHYSFAEDGKTNPADRDINNFNFTNTVTGESFMTMLGTPSRVGYTFLGWCREAEHTSQVVAANAIDYIKDYANKGDSFTLYSDWKAIEITITLDANKGTIAENPEEWTGSGVKVTKVVTYGSTYGMLPVPTRIGYTFLGWKYADAIIDETSNMFVSTNHTLTAQWQRNTYTVKFNKNGADCEDLMPDMTFIYDETVIPANLLTFTGHKFLGWKVNNEGEVRTEGESNLSSDQGAVVELFAQWQIEKYNLTFNLNGGTTESTIDGIYEYDQELPTNLTKVIAEKTYRFLGWSLTNDVNPTYAQTYTKCPDIGEDGTSATLYAMWTISDFNLTITLSNNNYATYTVMAEDGTVVAPIAEGGREYRLNAGLVYKLTVNLKSGYIFSSNVAEFDPSKVKVDINNNIFTISKINSNTEIIVNVEARLNTITINAAHATVTKVTVYNGEEIDKEITEEKIASVQIFTGQKVVIHAQPDAGYEIEDKVIEGFTADETINISATAKTYVLTVANSEGNEEPTFISGWTAGMIKTDNPIVLEVKVKDHYTNLQLSVPEGISIEESEGRYVITGFTDTFTLTITTEKMKYDVMINSVSVKRDEVDNTSTNRTAITTSETKALTGNGRETILTEYLTPFTFTASAQQAGYVFDGWYIGLVMENGRITDYGVKVDSENYTYDSSTNTYSYSGTVEAEYSLTAVFKYIEYTMSIAVDRTYNYGTFNYGTEVGLTNVAKPLPFGNTVEIKPVGNKGYEFDKWIVKGEVLTESNADLGIELFADGTLNVTGKGDLDFVVLFKAKKSSFKAETDIYINGIKVSSEGTNCATMQIGTLDEYGNFKANENLTKFSNGNVPFYTGDDIYLQVELSYGYEFAGFVSEGEGEAVVVDNEYRPGKTTIGEGINQKTYYVRKITSLNADNIYKTLKLKVNATAVNLTVNFINEDNKIVDAGKIFVDDSEFGVLANGNTGSNVSINAMVNKELTITAYSRFDFTIVSTGPYYRLNNTSTSIVNENRESIIDRTKGFTSSYKFSVKDFIDGTVISVKVVSSIYNVELYDEGNLVGEKITGVRVGDILNTTNVIAAIRELAASKSQYELIGFYTSENGIGNKYIDNDGNCLKAWDENGYYWNGQEYVTLPTFDSTTNTIKLYASWARKKSAIKLSTVPKGIKDVNPTVAAKLVITTINNTNSWTTENDLFFADMLYGADIGITAPVYENYLFNSWTIILDGVAQEPIYESTYFKKGGFNCKEVEIYANYFAKVSLSAEKGGTATLTSGEIVINDGSEDYVPTTTEFTLKATPNKGYIFLGWFNMQTGDLISNAANYIYRLDSENELSPMSIVAKYEGEAVRISVGDYDKSNGHIEKIYLNGEKVDEESINARIGDEVEFYVYVDTSKKYGIKWNSQFITYDRKEAVSMANTECLIYKYVVNADDVVDGEVIVTPTITEDKINIKLDIRLFNDSEYGEAGEITGDGIIDGKLSLSFGEDLVITVKPNDYYKIEIIQLDNRTIGEYLAGEMLIIPSSALNGLDATKEHTLLIRFTEKLWIETNNLPAQLQGEGTERNPYLITSAEELALVAYKINIEKNQSYANSRFKLTKDISLIGKFWTPIGTEDCKFNGVFNFNGFKVYGLSVQSGYDKENTFYNGVFANLGNRAEIIINNNAITIIAISCSVGVALIIIGLTIFFVVRKKRKKKMEELANG